MRGEYASAARVGADQRRVVLERGGVRCGPDRLRRGDHAEFTHPRQVGQCRHFDVLQAMATITRAVDARGMLVGVEPHADGAIADRVQRHLQSCLVVGRDGTVQRFLRHHGLAVAAADVWLEHDGGAGIDRAVEDGLGKAVVQQLPARGIAHRHVTGELLCSDILVQRHGRAVTDRQLALGLRALDRPAFMLGQTDVGRVLQRSQTERCGRRDLREQQRIGVRLPTARAIDR